MEDRPPFDKNGSQDSAESQIIVAALRFAEPFEIGPACPPVQPEAMS
jgi:hypothetical protein